MILRPFGTAVHHPSESRPREKQGHLYYSPTIIGRIRREGNDGFEISLLVPHFLRVFRR